MIRIEAHYDPIGYCQGCGAYVESKKNDKNEWMIVGHRFSFQNHGQALNFSLCLRCEDEIVRVIQERTNV